MISVMIRRYAVQVQAETGRSLQDILRDFVAAARDGFITFGVCNCCTVCGTKNTRIIVTRRTDSSTSRTHRCDFCGNVFRSEEKSGHRLENQPEPIAPKRKKRHIRGKGG